MNENTSFGAVVLYIVFVGAWVGGIAVAKGFWMTLASFLIPPVAWVVLAMRFLT